MKLSKTQKQLLKDIVYTICVLLFIVLVWQIIAYSVNEEYTLPKLESVFSEMFLYFSKNHFWKAFSATLFRTLLGFIISFIVSMFLVIVYKQIKHLRKGLNVFISIIRAIPTIAIILNLLLWTNSKIAPIIISCLVTLPQLFSSLLEQIESFDSDLIEMCKTYNVDNKSIFTKVYLPYVMPRLCLTLCSNFALTLKLIGSSEALCSTLNSIGNLMQEARPYNPAGLMALSIICIIVAILLENLLKFIIKKIWRINND